MAESLSSSEFGNTKHAHIAAFPCEDPDSPPKVPPLLTPHFPSYAPRNTDFLHLIKYLEESKLSADVRLRQEDEEQKSYVGGEKKLKVGTQMK